MDRFSPLLSCRWRRARLRFAGNTLRCCASVLNVVPGTARGVRSATPPPNLHLCCLTAATPAAVLYLLAQANAVSSRCAAHINILHGGAQCLIRLPITLAAPMDGHCWSGVRALAPGSSRTRQSAFRGSVTALCYSTAGVLHALL